MLLHGGRHGGSGLAGADDDRPALGRRDFGDMRGQAGRGMRGADRGVEHFAKKLAVVFGHRAFCVSKKRTCGAGLSLRQEARRTAPNVLFSEALSNDALPQPEGGGSPGRERRCQRAPSPL